MYHIRDFSLCESPSDSRDYIGESIFPEMLKVPRSLDLRSKLPPVRDQGSQGTCAAQSAACMKEYQERLDIGFKKWMSPQFIYNFRSNTDSSGMYLRDVMKILHKRGICPESEYPYGTLDAVCPFVAENAKNHIIKNYASIKSILGLKQALVQNGPCIIAFPVYNKGTRMWMPTYKGQPRRGGHAMAVVGYNSKGYIIRNSWSNYWGDCGYCIYPYTDWGAHWEIWTTIDNKSEVLPYKQGLSKLNCCIL